MSSENEEVSFEDLRPIPLALLRHDEPLLFPIRSEDGVLLLSEGSVVSRRNLEALENRGIRRILVHRSEPAANLPIEALGMADQAAPQQNGASVGLHTPATRRLDQMTASFFPPRQFGRPYRESLAPTGLAPYDEKASRQLWKRHEDFVTEFRNALQSVTGNQEHDLQSRSILHSYLELVVPDIDLFTCFAASPHHSHYPYRHSLHVAMLSIAMGLRSGFDRERLITLGMGALLHDIGMLRIPRALWSKSSPLTPEERNTVMEHPIHTVTALEECIGVSDDVRLICYQVHERGNGMGYPRQKRAENIHPLAKLVAVADMYVALVSERPFRKALMPYKALETILHLVRGGWLEAQYVRLLLETVALYPVGSYIILSDHRLAKVLRSNGERYDRPIVHAWPRRTPPRPDTGELLDLRDFPDLKVLEAVPAPPL